MTSLTRLCLLVTTSELKFYRLYEVLMGVRALAGEDIVDRVLERVIPNAMRQRLWCH